MKQIQWFPGHMQKARRQIEEKLPIIDIVFEIIDARIPESSRNPLLADIIRNKPVLMVLNKSDLADDAKTKEWINQYESMGLNCIAVNSLTEKILPKILKKTKEILKPLVEKEKERGMTNRAFKAMVIGIPNVGKSQFINNIAGKTKVKTGNMPGVTKIQSYIKTGGDLLLLDNPGVLWPKFENESVGFNLALLGSIKDDILPLDEVCIFGINFLIQRYPNYLTERYKISDPESMSPIEIMDEIGKVRGCKIAGGEIDYDRVINLFLYDLRNFKLGKLTLETVDDVEL